MAAVDVIALIEALGTSGVAASIAAVLTGKMSGKKQDSAADTPVVRRRDDGEKQRLAEEVVWLRQQVIMWQERAAGRDDSVK